MAEVQRWRACTGTVVRSVFHRTIGRGVCRVRHRLGSLSQRSTPFKIDRLARMEVTNERFVLREDFNPYRYLHNAWGIN